MKICELCRIFLVWSVDTHWVLMHKYYELWREFMLQWIVLLVLSKSAIWALEPVYVDTRGQPYSYSQSLRILWGPRPTDWIVIQFSPDPVTIESENQLNSIKKKKTLTGRREEWGGRAIFGCLFGLFFFFAILCGRFSLSLLKPPFFFFK